MNNYIPNYLSSIPPTDSDGNIDRRRVVTITVVQVAVKTTRLYVIVVRKILVAFCGIDYTSSKKKMCIFVKAAMKI